VKAKLIGTKKYKRNRFNHGMNMFPILVVVLCVATSLMMASFFSSIITTSGLGIIVSSAKTQSATTLWAISVGSCNTFAQAQELCADTQTKGGGGVILKKEMFHVLASAYEMENDATKVQENLAMQGVVAQMIKLEVKQTSVSANYTLAEVNVLDGCLLAYRDSFRTLFDLSVSLDTQTKNELAAKEQIALLVTRLEQIKADFATHLNKKLTANLVALSLQNETTLQLVKGLLETTTPLATATKTVYLTIIIKQMELLNELQTTVF